MRRAMFRRSSQDRTVPIELRVLRQVAPKVRRVEQLNVKQLSLRRAAAILDTANAAALRGNNEICIPLETD